MVKITVECDGSTETYDFDFAMIIGANDVDDMNYRGITLARGDYTDDTIDAVLQEATQSASQLKAEYVTWVNSRNANNAIDF